MTRWKLSALGRERARRMLLQPWIATLGRVVSSTERKAVETAQLLASRVGCEPELRAGIGENDRSATGPLPPDEFNRLADRFFAEPTQRVRGWESALDAQRRISAGLADLLRSSAPSDIAVVGHGGVGTLWYCELAGLPIDRRYDQPSQGHYFSVDLATGRPLHAWRPIDAEPDDGQS